VLAYYSNFMHALFWYTVHDYQRTNKGFSGSAREQGSHCGYSCRRALFMGAGLHHPCLPAVLSNNIRQCFFQDGLAEHGWSVSWAPVQTIPVNMGLRDGPCSRVVWTGGCEWHPCSRTVSTTRVVCTDPKAFHPRAV